MGILLETALPDRRFLLRLAAYRFAAAIVCLSATVVQLSRPGFGAPLRWLVWTGLWLMLMTGWFSGGLRALCLLQDKVEFYENGISFGAYDIPLAQLECVCWKQEPFRLLGVFPLPFLRDAMICVFHAQERKSKATRVRVRGFYFDGLREAFDRAYAFSIPWAFFPYKRKLKKRHATSETPQAFLGPAVPPTAPPLPTGTPPVPKQPPDENTTETI